MKKVMSLIAMIAIGVASNALAATINLSSISHNMTVNDGDVLTGPLSGFGWKISIADGATVTLSNVYIVTNNIVDAEYKWGGISCLGDATIILEGDNTVHGIGPDYPGIHVLEGKTLTIDGSGSLTAVGNKAAAGIGGGAGEYCYGWMTDLKPATCGSVVINGGTINAIGGSAQDTNYSNMSFGAGGAGIGSGYFCNGGTVVVNGGTITATGGICAAGIGTGTQAKSGDITINGGDVTACGGDCAAGIGSGTLGNASNIVINCGTVSAIGGYGSLIQSPGYEDNIFGGGAGIGSGYFSSCGDIAINGGIVTATGANCGAGIGSGGFTQICANWHGDCKCGLITIRGGRIVATGGESAAGIGGGAGIYNITGSISEWNRHDSVCSGIIISGGDIKATGGDMAAGIGSGEMRSKYGSITCLAKCGPRIKATQGWGYGEPIGHGYSIKPELCDSGPISMAPILDVRTGNSTYTVKWNGDLNYITDDITVYGDDPDLGKQVLTGVTAGTWKLTVADGATVKLKDAKINPTGTTSASSAWAGITCEGAATVILQGENIVNGFGRDYPGIFVPWRKRLTLEGDGSLTATGGGRGAGIGGGYKLDCGEIDIKGGIIMATGGEGAAGIGGGPSADCGDLFVRAGIARVIATCGGGNARPIGNGDGGGIVGPSVASGLSDDKGSPTRAIRAMVKVAFDANGGSVSPASKNVANGVAMGSLPTPTWSGHTFNGWYTARSGGTKITTTATVTAPMTCYAQWTVKQYKLTFDANGGKVSPAYEMVDYCKTCDTFPAPTWSGHTFNGWFTARTGGTKVTAPWKCTGNKTIYAQWTVKQYKLTFDANGGKVSPAYEMVDYCKTCDTFPTPTWGGHTFNGWYTARSGGTKVTAPWKCTGNKTIYAQWTVKMYTITFDANGGKVSPASTKLDYCAIYTPPTPTWSGHAFDGWYTAKTGGTKVTSPAKCTGNATLYAHWK